MEAADPRVPIEEPLGRNACATLDFWLFYVAFARCQKSNEVHMCNDLASETKGGVSACSQGER
jgi:hypothetical protein